MMEIWQRHQGISRLLSHNVKQRIGQVVPLYLGRARSLQDPYSLYRAASDILKLRFPSSSAEETDILAFYLVGRAAVPMDEPSEMTSLRLQVLIDRRSKFMQALSNIMQKISSTQDTIVQNIK